MVLEIEVVRIHKLIFDFDDFALCFKNTILLLVGAALPIELSKRKCQFENFSLSSIEYWLE